MNIVYHFILGLLISYFFEFNLENTLIFVLAGVLIDLDHPLYYLISESANRKGKSIINFKKWCLKEYHLHRPHFYLFHTFEFLLLFCILGVIMDGLIKYIAFGFLFHFLVDILTYLFVYRSTKPWLKSLFIFFWIR